MRPVTAQIRGFICIAKELKFREKDPTAIYHDGKIADWDTMNFFCFIVSTGFDIVSLNRSFPILKQ